jgi:hypothetical protein
VRRVFRGCPCRSALRLSSAGVLFVVLIASAAAASGARTKAAVFRQTAVDLVISIGVERVVAVGDVHGADP